MVHTVYIIPLLGFFTSYDCFEACLHCTGCQHGNLHQSLVTNGFRRNTGNCKFLLCMLSLFWTSLHCHNPKATIQNEQWTKGDLGTRWFPKTYSSINYSDEWCLAIILSNLQTPNVAQQAHLIYWREIILRLLCIFVNSMIFFFHHVFVQILHLLV